jgi:hypothetical protein
MSSVLSIEDRKKRWCSFYDLKSSTKYLYMIDIYSDLNKRRPLPWKNLRTERMNWILENYYKRLEASSWLNDDSIPYIDMLTGTELFAEAFGCKVHYPKDNMPFALPLVSNSAEASKIQVPDLWNCSLTYLFEMADELKEKAGESALLRLVDIQSPMDIAALIWDKNDFYIALIEEPEAVKELAEKVKIFLTQFLDEWFRRYGREFIAHYPDYFIPYGVTLSEDEIGAVNSKMFQDLFFPELTYLSERYGSIGMHCCADSMHQWNGLKNVPNLKLLNLVRPTNQLTKAYKTFEAVTTQMHSWYGHGNEPEAWINSLPQNAHVVFQCTANNKEDALRLCEKFKMLCR